MMKAKYVLLFFCLPAMPAMVIAQATTPLVGCPDTYVITYKQGTNCSPAAYTLRTINLNGVVSGTEVASTDTSHELNAFGINADGYIYGLVYNRYSTGAATCAFNNIKLYRYDANGGYDSLGAIIPPHGGTVTTAIGLVANPNRYIFFARDSVNALMMGVIENINTLAGGNGSLNAQYFYMTNNCAGKSYADFAVNPSDGKLYAYGIYTEGNVKGTVLVLDAASQSISCMGTPNTTEFTSANDNFGGIMFGNDGFMYGVNIFTKKFYKIDVGTGAVTYVSTIPASTVQIRADLGSCAISSVALSAKVISFTGILKAGGGTKLQWVTAPKAYERFEVQKSSDGRDFRTCATVNGEDFKSSAGSQVYNWQDSEAALYYRLKVYSGKASTYSSTVSLAGKELSVASPGIHPNPAHDFITVSVPESYKSAAIAVYDSIGSLIHRQTLSGEAESRIDISMIVAGIYNAILEVDGERSVHRLVISR